MSSPEEPTIGRLVGDASRDIALLVQTVIKLAKSELRVSAKAGAVGIGMIAVSAFFGLLIIVLLSIAAAYFIVMAGLDPAWAFLIVAGFYLVLVALLILVGIRLLKKIRAPEKTIAAAKEIPAALKGHTDAAAGAQTPLTTAPRPASHRR
ncbi:phage holin family protein [Aeromicrobium wangtongii]|uniref:Phage holin family protein n=1 Tax=Aeromicrobium wangtongii TaxID=2969247 RepID=A0ABY5M731_9ACTN|nr:phage holin family protein [Aeromicrobium wangtongii]MCD9199621.1 phage holin family protein [Aeromicrobium wangtongii]UUP13973.1 phage holin family protein [Aeromicrobium wangtongii]